MDRPAFLRYTKRFNQADAGAFRENLADDVIMQNGGMILRGLNAVLEHYEQRIWSLFKESVHAASRPSLAILHGAQDNFQIHLF